MNKIAENQWQKQLTTAKANDQERILCSVSGIQSESSARMPNVITAMVQQSPVKRQH